MKTEIKQLSFNCGNEEYEMLQNIKNDENGFSNMVFLIQFMKSHMKNIFSGFRKKMIIRKGIIYLMDGFHKPPISYILMISLLV